MYEDGSYRVCATEKFREKKGGYYGCIKSINLPANATAEEIGKAIIDVFKAAEEYYEQNPMEYWLKRNIDMDKNKITKLNF